VPSYADWNSALIEFFTYGAPSGSTIYLDVNNRNLEQIGRQFWPEIVVGSWPERYLSDVRSHIDVDKSETLKSLHRRDWRNRPLGVAFLGALVLVATRMDHDAEQQISDRDYFTRLNDALGTSPSNSQNRRPRFMASGADAEEPLWMDWAKYLRGRGYLPTATVGTGAWKYISYAVSQTLLRAHEKRRLQQLFNDKHWQPDLDPETLVNRLRHEGALPVHVQNLLKRTGQAAEDVQHALNEVYLEWQEGDDLLQARPGSAGSQLVAGLYRTEHWRTGATEYAYFVRQPRNQRLLTVEAELPDGPTTLQIERPGYYAPVGRVTADDLTGGVRLALQGHPQLESLVLPLRTLWVLRPDPDLPGAFASLGRPTVGEHFLLLASDKHRDDLTRLRELGLLQWEKDEPFWPGWREYHAAMVLANHWTEAVGLSDDLREAISPTSGVSLSITGGVSVPQSGAWLAEGPPQVRVNSFFLDVTLTVRKDDITLVSHAVEPNATVAVPWDGPGVYELDAESRGQGYKRIVNLIDWADLPDATPERLGQEHLKIGSNAVLIGPRLVELPKAD